MQAHELIDRFRAREELLKVSLKDGVIVTFTLPRSAEQFYLLRESAQRWIRSISSNPSPPMKAYLPMPDGVLEQCFWVKTLATDPAFNDVEILQLAKECGATLPVLYMRLMSEIGSQVLQMEAEEIERQGED